MIVLIIVSRRSEVICNYPWQWETQAKPQSFEVSFNVPPENWTTEPVGWDLSLFSLYLCLSTYLSIFPSTYLLPSIHLSTYLSIYLSIYHLSIWSNLNIPYCFCSWDSQKIQHKVKVVVYLLSLKFQTKVGNFIRIFIMSTINSIIQLVLWGTHFSLIVNFNFM